MELPKLMIQYTFKELLCAAVTAPVLSHASTDWHQNVHSATISSFVLEWGSRGKEIGQFDINIHMAINKSDRSTQPNFLTIAQIIHDDLKSYGL